MKKILLILAGLLIVLFVFREPITMAIVKRQAAWTMTGGGLRNLPDGLNVILCGAAGPMQSAHRSGPCTMVVAGKRVFVVDTGPGSARNIGFAGVQAGAVEAVLLTHFHSDHIGDLGELMLERWIGGSHADPLPIYGPPGVDQVVAGFNQAYRLDDGYRTAHHGSVIAPPSGAGGIAHPFPMPASGQGQVVLDDGGLKITAFAVDHEPVEPAVGYRFDYEGRSAVLSGDTRKTDNLVHFAKGADLLVNEALSPELMMLLSRIARSNGKANLADIFQQVLGYHTSPVQAAEMARDAGVRFLLLDHITPPLPLPTLQAIFLKGVSAVYSGPVRIGKDGTCIQLPAHSTTIKARQCF